MANQGIEEIKQEVLEVIDFMKNPQKYAQMGVDKTKGVLLSGPPGCGKTLLARAIAKEAGCNFISVNGSEFDEMFVGLGAQRVKKLFAAAAQAQPCIVFIDEIDAIAGKRSTHNRFLRQCMSMLLTSMDGFEEMQNVLVIGATNLPEALDPAILRPGRFDLNIKLQLPSFAARYELFAYYLGRLHHRLNSAHVQTLVRLTTGFNCADIMDLTRNAALVAGREGAEAITNQHVELAFDQKMMGLLLPTGDYPAWERRATAIHEAGHAVACLLNDEVLPLHKITILPRGQALGVNLFLSPRDYEFHTIEEQRRILRVLMGGRVAEEISTGLESVTTGCSSDLSKATEIARKMVVECGYPRLTLAGKQREMGEEKQKAVDDAIEAILRAELENTKRLLRQHWSVVEKLADALVARETLTRPEIRAVINM